MRGLRGDLGAVALADEAALERYAFRVAGTVGLMMCDVLGVEAASARRAAVDLGIAMQFTNIARDVVEDARAGRRYLPATWLDLSPRRLARPDGAARRMAAPAVARLLDRAEARYAGGWRGFSHLPRSARPGIAAAAALYRAIGTGIAASGHDIAAPCARPGRGRRLAIALGAAGQALVAPDPAARRRPSIDRDTDTETDSMGAPDARP
jgi:phytoene synthase